MYTTQQTWLSFYNYAYILIYFNVENELFQLETNIWNQNHWLLLKQQTKFNYNEFYSC